MCKLIKLNYYNSSYEYKVVGKLSLKNNTKI